MCNLRWCTNAAKYSRRLIRDGWKYPKRTRRVSPCGQGLEKAEVTNVISKMAIDCTYGNGQSVLGHLLRCYNYNSLIITCQ